MPLSQQIYQFLKSWIREEMNHTDYWPTLSRAGFSQYLPFENSDSVGTIIYYPSLQNRSKWGEKILIKGVPGVKAVQLFTGEDRPFS